MGRLARITLPGIPYHVTQRGNRRQPVFFREDDYRQYLVLLREQGQRWGLRVWAYCLMTNHVHLIVVPDTERGLIRALAETHRCYTRYVNFREGWRGYLWQGRFASVPLDEAHLVAAIRYVERNPVEAGMVQTATGYPWSSARAHVTGTPDPVLAPCFVTDQITDWATFLATPNDPALVRDLEAQSRTGRPHGPAHFVTQLEHQLGRPVRKRRPGPQPVVK